VGMFGVGIIYFFLVFVRCNRFVIGL